MQELDAVVGSFANLLKETYVLENIHHRGFRAVSVFSYDDT